MTDLPRVILHVGTEKTGSTAIQKAASSAHAELLKAGWLLPASFGPTPHVRVTTAAVDFSERSALVRLLRLQNKKSQDALRNTLSADIADEIQKKRPDTVLITDEHINVHLSSIQQLLRMRSFIEEFAQVDEVVLFFRRQDNFLAALISESIKLGRFGIFDPENPKPVGNTRPYRFSYQKIISNFEAAFRGARLVLKCYQENPEYSTVREFEGLYPELKNRLREPTQRQNSSLSAAVAMPLLIIGNQAFKNGNQELLLRWPEVIAASQQLFPGSPWRLPKTKVTSFLEDFKSENEWIASRHEQFSAWLNPTYFDSREDRLPNRAECESVIDSLSAKIDARLANNLASVLNSIPNEKFSENRASTAGNALNYSSEKRLPDSLQLTEPGSVKEEGASIRAKCPVCAQAYIISTALPAREGPLCPRCQVSGRGSAIVYHFLRLATGSTTRSLAELRRDASVKALGLSDSPRYSEWLERKFKYRNTYLHKRPRLDVTRPPRNWLNWADVVISADVFEHVVGNSIEAFNGVFSMLRPGGSLILTVPFVNVGEAIEHYPGLIDYRARVKNGVETVELIFAGGIKRIADNPVFHGGPGSTLELRIFNRHRLLCELEQAGFIDIQVHDDNLPESGIVWGPASRPITARKPQ